jgi:hypothetical protein
MRPGNYALHKKSEKKGKNPVKTPKMRRISVTAVLRIEADTPRRAPGPPVGTVRCFSVAAEAAENAANTLKMPPNEAKSRLLAYISRISGAFG